MFINASNFVCFSFDIISNFVIFNSTLYRTSVVIFINSILFCSAIDIYLHDLLDISLQLKRTQFTNWIQYIKLPNIYNTIYWRVLVNSIFIVHREYIQ